MILRWCAVCGKLAKKSDADWVHIENQHGKLTRSMCRKCYDRETKAKQEKSR